MEPAIIYITLTTDTQQAQIGNKHKGSQLSPLPQLLSKCCNLDRKEIQIDNGQRRPATAPSHIRGGGLRLSAAVKYFSEKRSNLEVDTRISLVYTRYVNKAQQIQTRSTQKIMGLKKSDSEQFTAFQIGLLKSHFFKENRPQKRDNIYVPCSYI